MRKSCTGLQEGGGVAAPAVTIRHTPPLSLYLSRATGATPKDGVPDMTVISDIDEFGINTNLKVRYRRDQIYVRV